MFYSAGLRHMFVSKYLQTVGSNRGTSYCICTCK